MKKLFRNILFIFIGLFLLGGIGATVLIVKAYRELPDLGQIGRAHV